MKFRYDGELKADLVLRDQTYAGIMPGQVIDVPFAINNALFTPMDTLADLAQGEYRKEWAEWPTPPAQAEAGPVDPPIANKPGPEAEVPAAPADEDSSGGVA